jgi:hypothetical protein
MRFILAYAGVSPVAEVAVECTESFFGGLCFGRGVCSRSHLPAVGVKKGNGSVRRSESDLQTNFHGRSPRP